MYWFMLILFSVTTYAYSYRSEIPWISNDEEDLCEYLMNLYFEVQHLMR